MLLAVVVASTAAEAHDLPATFGSQGMTAGGVSVRLAAWGRDGAMIASEDLPPEVALHRVQYVRPGVVEWWEDRPEGLEHGFTVTDPPRGDGPLVFTIAITGAEPVGTWDETLLRRPSGDALLYGALAAWDESGRTLPAWMEPTEDGTRIVVDDAGAIGTVTVDPLLTLAWQEDGDQFAAYFGVRVSTAGDTNGDGYDDVVVAAYNYDNGQMDEGRAYVYLGSAGGLATTPAWTAESDQANAWFGFGSSAGDVNGDGYGDVLIGAYFYDNGQTDEGRAFVYLGSAGGLATTTAWTAESDQISSYFVWAVSSAGDVNGDGYGDVLVGAHSYDGGQTDEGRAYVYLGSAAGLAATAAWTAESNQPNAYYGFSVSAAGDVNGDGYGDVIVGAWRYDNGETGEGGASVYLGSPAGLATTPAWFAEGDEIEAQFGFRVASAGDVNGDGYDDVLVSAPYYGLLDYGRAFLYLGSAAGLATVAAWAQDGDQAYAFFGRSVASAGDVNDDGYGDVVIGAYLYDNGQTDEGRAFVYLGSSAGLATTPAWAAESDQAYAYFGGSTSSAGDVNGDGYGDLTVGAVYYDTGPGGSEGRAYVYHGACYDQVDADLDTIGDRCDLCPGFDDLLDADFDGTADDCDACPGFDDTQDLEGDGIPDRCDGCPDAFDPLQFDSDVDGVNNVCDACEGFDDTLDADLDLAPDACDVCPGSDDALDVDFDAVPDACDLCPDSDDAIDADLDLVPDDCDICPLIADPSQLDSDVDTLGDACDSCPGFDDALDADLDLSPDGCDRCPDFDDAIDADLDLAPDVCDRCPGFDDAFDADLDLVPDACDVCGLGDDALDLDLDAQPDACDLCPSVPSGPDLDGDGYATCTGDCWEGNPAVFPDAPETPDGIDEDCDGVVDDGTIWSDDDGDGASEAGGDCDDADSSRFPGALDSCDDIDQDCDGIACTDVDGDGYTVLDGDCADADPLVFPGALELLDNRIDDDCDGVVDPGHWDPDGDGVERGDCAPDDRAVFPGNPESENGIDDNCDGRIDEGTSLYDDDGDGFSEAEGDCNDTAADVFPGATEVADRRDQDCNALIDEGTVNFDDDGDGQAEIAGDCDDGDDDVHPGVLEVANGIDDDCDDQVDEGTTDVDGDGWTLDQGDCDDTTGWMNPEQLEICDGLDNDCDGVVDDACSRPTREDDEDVPSGCGCDSGRPAAGWMVGLIGWLASVTRRRLAHRPWRRPWLRSTWLHPV